jgi:phage repressor protein C with HTH and peptisase S24 domain
MSTEVKERPDWAGRITNLRESLRLNQAEFARKLRRSAMAVSRWERGILEPPTEIYIQLGNVAGNPERWYFWGRAGLDMADVSNALTAPDILTGEPVRASAGAGARIALSEQAMAALPVLPVMAGTVGAPGDLVNNLERITPEEMIALPRNWCPHPERTVCIKVRGNSMFPLIHEGNIIAVDLSDRDQSDLDNKVVLLWHRDSGLVISRFRQFDGIDVLIPENRDYESVTIKHDLSWRVLGRVLWWMGRP